MKIIKSLSDPSTEKKKKIKNQTLLLYHHPGQQVSAIHMCANMHIYLHTNSTCASENESSFLDLFSST